MAPGWGREVSHAAPLGLSVAAECSRDARVVAGEPLRGMETIRQMTGERRFQLLVDAVTDCAIYMLDPEGYIVSWNSGAKKLKRYAADQIIGQHFSVLYNDEDRLADMPARALEVAKQQGTWQADGWRKRKDDSVFWASEAINAIRDEQGALIGFAKVTRDITEQHQAQEALDKSQEQLGYLKKMEALGRLTGSIAHNFNNLLMIVSGHAQTVRGLVKNDAKGLRAVDAIEIATKRGATLTRHMLSFSGRRQLNPETADLKGLVEGFGWLLNSLIVNIQLTIQIPQDVWPVEIDASELELALVNMVLNSREAMPHGGSITITAENVHLPDSESPKHLCGDFVALRIADTGSGIPAEVLPKIFDPFFTTKESNRSAGLGLSQVYGFAVQSRGAVGAKSETGKGTEITMHLPRTIAVAVSVRSGEDSDAASLAGGRVLIVEDDAEVAEVTASLIDQLGYKCRLAIDAEDALQMFERGEKFDLVFSDVAMPGAMDGLGLAHTLRRRYPGVPILLASGLTPPNEAAEEELLLLRKPYGLEDLRRAVNRVLSKSGTGSGDESNLVRFPNKQRQRTAANPDNH
jgi:PAS domain S-box-containing protein